MAELHLIQYIKVDSQENLLPTLRIESGRDPFDYAIMLPDYTWYYFTAYDTEWGKRFKPVNVVGEDK